MLKGIMDQQKNPGRNETPKPMDRREEVHSNDRKMKQDFPGYPHFPANEAEMKEDKNRRTDFSNESDTTATGSESVRGEQRPSQEENKTVESEQEFLKANDRGMMMHDEDPGDMENGDKESR